MWCFLLPAPRLHIFYSGELFTCEDIFTNGCGHAVVAKAKCPAMCHGTPRSTHISVPN